MTSLSCSAQDRAGIVWVRVAGEVDTASASALEFELTGIAGPVTVLDLRGVGFMDAAGLTALVRAHRRAVEDGRELIALPSRRVRRLLRLVAVDLPQAVGVGAGSGPARWGGAAA